VQNAEKIRPVPLLVFEYLLDVKVKPMNEWFYEKGLFMPACTWNNRGGPYAAFKPI
jgi:hypothetical protein